MQGSGTPQLGPFARTVKDPNFFLLLFSPRLLSSSTRTMFTLSDLLVKPWSQVSPLLPPGHVPSFLSRIGFRIPTARRFSSNCCYLMFSRFPLIILSSGKSSCEYVHSVRIEPTKLILVGTRIIYQATGDCTGHLFRVRNGNTDPGLVSYFEMVRSTLSSS